MAGVEALRLIWQARVVRIWQAPKAGFLFWQALEAELASAKLTIAALEGECRAALARAKAAEQACGAALLRTEAAEAEAVDARAECVAALLRAERAEVACGTLELMQDEGGDDAAGVDAA